MPMRVQVAIPEDYIDAPVLDSALEAVTRLNESMIANREVPLFSEAINRVRWQAEPPGQEHFDHAGTVLRRGNGDCDDLAPWHAASLRATGEDPGASAIAYESGPRRWHAVVQRSDGSLDDPSLAAGMPGHSGIRPATVPLMDQAQNAVVGGYLLRPQIAVRPMYGQWQARADLPWHWREHVTHDEPTQEDWAMTTLHRAPVASTALVGAIQGVLDLAEVNCAGSEEHLDRLEALQAAAHGWPYEDIAEVWGEDHARAALTVIGHFAYMMGPSVGSFLDTLVDVAIPVAASFIPGGAIIAPIAQQVYHAARNSGATHEQATATAQATAQAVPEAAAQSGQFNPQGGGGGQPGPGRICLSF